LLTLDEHDDIPDIDSGVIFDFGGYIDKRLIRAASLSYCTIVPTLPEVSEIQGCISTIQALKNYSQRIIIIANKTETKADFNIVKDAVSAIGNFPIFEIKKSRALPNIYLEKKSIQDMMNDSPLLRFSYKKVSEQFSEICNYLLHSE
jgi:MinD-like ATPase involved in chromosome partitioning or flagellar assembly